MNKSSIFWISTQNKYNILKNKNKYLNHKKIPMKVAIKSVKWTFHEIATKQYFPNEQRIDILEEKDIDSLIEDVASEKADYWVIEIENTVTWTIYDHLNSLKNENINIIWETYLKVEKNLAALPWATLSTVKYAFWEHTAIEQTRKYFEKNFPEIKLVEVWDLSIAWREIISKNSTNSWLIWWKLAAKKYGFNILIDKIDEAKKNYTRFFVIQKKKEENRKFNKASLHILLPNQVGSLMKILWVIAAYEMNLTKIESVPIPWEPFHYSFYIDITFPFPEMYNNMINAIKPLVKELNILWEYQVNDKYLWE